MKRRINGRKRLHLDLVASVGVLADRLRQRSDPETGGMGTLSPGIIDQALSKAKQAQQTIATQEERIARLEEMIRVDPLTGLLNRRGLEQELHRVMAACRRYRERAAMIFTDLDGFKPINDTYGHAVGDEVLKEVARLLTGNVRQSDYVARVGGDEFVVLLMRISWEHGSSRAEALKQLLNNAYVRTNGRMIAVRASLGAIPFDGWEDPEELLALADRAMYRNKRARFRPAGSWLHELNGDMNRES
jgi:diguanylate cyclase (GGDEF)-like protein